MGKVELIMEGNLTTACPLCRPTEFRAWRYSLLRCEQCDCIVDEALWRSAANEQLNESFFGCFFAILRSLLRKKHLKQIRQESSAGISHSTFFVEHAYRLSMVASGVLTLPMRWPQEQLGKGDELVVVARNGSYD